jgi:tRNA-specific 2-thiouridylase
VTDVLNWVLERLRQLPGIRPGDRVVAAMSGGLDSSIMAALLHQAGYEVVGISMQLFEKPGGPDAAAGRCCTLDDFQDARRVAAQVGFPHYVMDYASRPWSSIPLSLPTSRETLQVPVFSVINI